MLSLEGEVTKVSEIQNKNGFIYRNIEVYYGNAENPIFTMRKPMCYECDLQVGDQVRIYFEIKAPKGYNNLYVEKYCKLNNTIYDCAPQTVNQPDDTEDIRLDDESERALDIIFGPESDTVREQQRQREAMIAKVNPILQKLRADTDGNKRTPAVYDHELNTKSIANDSNNAFMNNLCQYGEAVRYNKQTPNGVLPQIVHKDKVEPDNAFIEMNDNTAIAVRSNQENDAKATDALAEGYKNKNLIGFF